MHSGPIGESVRTMNSGPKGFSDLVCIQGLIFGTLVLDNDQTLYSGLCLLLMFYLLYNKSDPKQSLVVRT